MTDWQPIETAPKDGRKIWLFWPKNGAVAEGMGVGFYHVVAGVELWIGGIPAMAAPTYWQPLPAPPQAPT